MINNEKKKRKLLIVLNYWAGDRDMAKSLADLIAALEPKMNEIADFAFHRRYDAEQMPTVVLDRLKEKFSKVHDLKCRRMNAIGYPYGSNEMFYDLLERVSNKDWQMEYYAFLNLEADCCPLSPDWIEQMFRAYEEAYNNGKHAAGHIHYHPSLIHLNGVAVYSMDFWHRAGGMNIIGGPANIGYDTHHANRIVPISLDVNAILLDFNRKTITEKDLETLTKNGVRPALYHGIKDLSAQTAIYNKYVVTRNNQMIHPQKLKTICTYYDMVPEQNQQEQEAILALWKKAWKDRGYNTVVFGEWDASKHILYPKLKELLKTSKAPVSRKRSVALLLRWMALEYCGGGFFTEYDVLPCHSFTSDDLPSEEGVNRLQAGSMAGIVADRHGLSLMNAAICNYFTEPKEIIATDKDIVDSLDDKFWLRGTNICSNWNVGRWAESKLVHFSLDACKSAGANPSKATIISQYLKTL